MFLTVLGLGGEFTPLRMKFKTAVPPPRITDKKALNEPRTRPMLPLTIAQMDSSRLSRVPTFCLAKSMIPFKLNISEKWETVVKKVKMCWFGWTTWRALDVAHEVFPRHSHGV
mgnify:FL=1